MDPVAGEFNFTRLEKVTFGPGKAAGLGHELERRGLNRALIVTGKTLGRSKLLDQVTALEGSCVVPSLKVPVALSCTERCGVKAAFCGVTAIETRVDGATVRVEDPVIAS